MKLASIVFALMMLQSRAASAAELPKTLLELAGAQQQAARLADSVLVIIDAQREYVDGKLPLVGIEPTIREAALLLMRARKAGTPVIHIVQQGRGTLFN